MNGALKNTIAKELTLKAIEAQLLRLKTDSAQDGEAVGKEVAALFNAIKQEIDLPC